MKELSTSNERIERTLIGSYDRTILRYYSRNWDAPNLKKKRDRLWDGNIVAVSVIPLELFLSSVL